MDGCATRVGPRRSPAVMSPGWIPGGRPFQSGELGNRRLTLGQAPPHSQSPGTSADGSVTSLWGSCPLFVPRLGRQCWCSKQIKTCLQGPSAPRGARPRAGLPPRVSLKLYLRDQRYLSLLEPFGVPCRDLNSRYPSGNRDLVPGSICRVLGAQVGPGDLLAFKTGRHARERQTRWVAVFPPSSSCVALGR